MRRITRGTARGWHVRGASLRADASVKDQTVMKGREKRRMDRRTDGRPRGQASNAAKPGGSRS